MDIFFWHIISAKFMASTKPFWQQESQYQHYRGGKLFGTHTAQVIVITCLTASTVFIYDGLQVKCPSSLILIFIWQEK